MIHTFYDIPAHSYYHILTKKTVLSLLPVCAKPTVLAPEDYQKIANSIEFIMNTLYQIVQKGQFIRENIVIKVHYKQRILSKY